MHLIHSGNYISAKIPKDVLFIIELLNLVFLQYALLNLTFYKLAFSKFVFYK
jgi:hypothetical protein